MKLVLPYPPSANMYWRKWRGRVVKSNEARKYQEHIRLMALIGRRPVVATDVRVELHVYRPAKRGDLDNSIKVLLDALKGVAYVDDKQVVEIHAVRRDDAAAPRVEVEVVETREATEAA